MKIGYARVAPGEHSMQQQEQILRKAGCTRIFRDQGVSGGAIFKPAYIEALEYARPGDELVVWKLDRLSRRLAFLLDEIATIEAKGLAFHSLTENIDTTVRGGEIFFHAIAALATFERDVSEDRARESDIKGPTELS